MPPTRNHARRLRDCVCVFVFMLFDLYLRRFVQPENILCGEELDDLKIADFGLSQVVDLGSTNH